MSNTLHIGPACVRYIRIARGSVQGHLDTTSNLDVLGPCVRCEVTTCPASAARWRRRTDRLQRIKDCSQSASEWLHPVVGRTVYIRRTTDDRPPHGLQTASIVRTRRGSVVIVSVARVADAASDTLLAACRWNRIPPLHGAGHSENIARQPLYYLKTSNSRAVVDTSDVYTASA